MAEVETTQCKGGWLDVTTFETVIASTPLVSIDLLVKNRQGEYLFGLRKNRPAQGYWFVPGGRIQKSESLDAAFRSLTHEELGLFLERSAAQFKGVYEHFYKDSIFGEEVSTHYVVLAFDITLPADSAILDSQQHSVVLWIKPVELSRNLVYQHSLDYFQLPT